MIYQARRAQHFAETRILGGSPSAAAARAAIWRASMGSDFHVYAAGLYRRMDEIPVLITGKTGTGKELAAQAVGWSRYIPFDEANRRFAGRYGADFHARNVCEVPRDLVESALFGHKRGAFSGAIADAAGVFALPKPFGTLFLDEIGELPEHLQVKLLRPLQSREFIPLGETTPRKLAGRLVFATHQDLEALCRAGTFRADLLERMNGVHVSMPPLCRMLAEAPGELSAYVRAFAAEKIDDPAWVDRWTDRIVGSIQATLHGYDWPRNLRELKNYTERYILTDGRLADPAPRLTPKPIAATITPTSGTTPVSTAVPSSGLFGPRAKEGAVTLDELARAYATRVHVLTEGNKAETARRLGLNWRTVGKLLDPTRLFRWVTRRSNPTS